MNLTDTNGDRRRKNRGEPADEPFTLSRFLEQQKVAELQQMWGFWQNGARAPTRKQELIAPLLEALLDESKVRARIQILSERPREILVRLVRHEGYTAGLPELLVENGGRRLEPYEVEAAASALSKRGFLRVLRGEAAGPRAHECYEVPADLGELIAALLHEERRGPREVFSLAGHVAALTPAARRRLLDTLGRGRRGAAMKHKANGASNGLAAPGVAEHGNGHGNGNGNGNGHDFDPANCTGDELTAALLGKLDGDELLSRIDDERLRNALRGVAVEHGGIAPRSEFETLLGGDHALDRKRLRAMLEDRALGTVTSLSLGDYGVELGGETVVLFEEVTERVLDTARPADGPAHDRVDAARVDLLADLQQFLHLVSTTPLRVTQGRTIYRAAQHRILDAFTFCEDALMDHPRIFDVVYDLAFGLELVEVTDESRLRLSRKGESWDSLDLTDNVRAIYGRFLEERLPEGRDFHVRRLRRALAAELARAPVNAFVPLLDVPFRVRNDYLATMDEQGVRDHYRNRFLQYTDLSPRETPAQLTQGLVDYAITRLYPLGMIDVALAGEVPVGVKLTELGRNLLLGERISDVAPPTTQTPAEVRPLVVNPDFEVLLFPEGDVNEIAHGLTRFAQRTKSEEVSHYRITREGVERAVVKGMDADEILDFIARHSRVPMPQNVSYSIREWAERVSFAWQRDVVLLTTSDAEAMERVVAVDEVARILVERITPTVAALRTRITDWTVLETLRKMGVYFK